MGLFFLSIGYVKIYKNRFVLQIATKEIFIEKIGHFSHERMLIGNFSIAESCLRAALSEGYPSRLLPSRPAIIMHPKEIIDGGLSEIETRVFKELALGAGAGNYKIWNGHDLSQNEISEFTF